MACRGSKTHLRGFPCGVWTIIHAMSVQAYKIEKDSKFIFILSLIGLAETHYVEKLECLCLLYTVFYE